MIDFMTNHAALIGLVFFFLFFCAVGLWTFRPGARSSYQKYARLPLEENEE